MLGSTGSIGCSALDLARRYPADITIHGLAAGRDVQGLAAQVREFRPRQAVIADHSLFRELKALCAGCPETELAAGPQALEELARGEAHVILAAIVGFAALRPVLRAVQAGKQVALANKECVVAGGRLLAEANADRRSLIIPVDSEHSAIFQALRGHNWCDLERLILTASGGPFLKTPVEDFRNIRPEQALNHPNWKMGGKITIDSSTMVNKGLELIEAAWLFGLPGQQIDVMVHPQSIVHSLVEFCDGTQLAQLSNPDMRGPIAYAVTYPGGRLRGVMQPLRLADLGSLEFMPVDHHKFPAVQLARECLSAGQGMPAVFNAANEAAVRMFLEGALTFDRIVPAIARAVERFSGSDYRSLDDLLSLDAVVKAEVGGAGQSSA